MSGAYERFGSAGALAKLASDWPATRLAEVWNGLPSVKPIRKFKDRATGAGRVWQALQRRQPEGVPDVAPQMAPASIKKPAASKQASAGQEAPKARQGGRTALRVDANDAPNARATRAYDECNP